MLAKILNYINTSEKRINIISLFLAIVTGLLFGLVIMIIVSPRDSFPAFLTSLTGGFRDIGRVLEIATPLIFTGLSVGFAFKTGLFNIGAPGQLMIGAISAIYIGVRVTFLPAPIHWIVAVLCAGLAGALWGAIPGILKAYRNVNEVVATIMMNYISLYFVSYAVEYQLYDLKNARSLTVAKSAQLPYLGLDKIFTPNTVNFGFILAIIAIVIIYIILEKTTFGFELKAVGFNQHSSKYAGVNDKKGIIMAMLISGLLSGLAGAAIYLTDSFGRHLETTEILIAEGFNGIPVALIGFSNPIGIFFSAIFIGFIELGGFYMQRYDLAPEIIDIIIASIIYFSALLILFRGIIIRLLKHNRFKHKKREEEDG